MQACLMLGAGHSPLKRKLAIPSSVSEEQTIWTSLDMNPDCDPDILFELDLIESGQQIPVEDESFDEIHAYDLMEHYGRQGYYEEFFCGMRELWRILKPGGHLIGITPMWNVMWTLSDPGHRRVISAGTLSYLTREMYESLGSEPTTDYRRYVDPCWWKMVPGCCIENADTGGFSFTLGKA